MSSPLQSALIILCMAAMTFFTRALPFMLWGKNKKLPPFIAYLASVLPYAMMGLLVVYCLRGTTILSYPYGIPELISVIVVTVLHLYKKNTLLSIIGGTSCYMFLIQCIFV